MKRCLALCLAFSLSLAPLSALEPRSSSSSPVTLSAEDAAAIEEAILQAREALAKSSEEIARLSRLSTTLWIACGVLAAALAADTVADLVRR